MDCRERRQGNRIWHGVALSRCRSRQAEARCACGRDIGETEKPHPGAVPGQRAESARLRESFDSSCPDTQGHGPGGHQATRHLIDQGYRRIAFVQGPADSWHGELRYQGYCHALEEAALAGLGGGPERGDCTEEGARAACLRILARRERPEAIFAANDEMALGILHMLGMQGFRVPMDMALVGFDDIRVTQYVTPALTTVRQPMCELGVLAMDQILAVWSGEKSSLEPIWLPTELVIRASSRMVASSDRQEARP